MSKKGTHIVYVISRIEKSIAFEWIAVALKQRYQVAFVLLNGAPSTLETFLVDNKIEVKRIHFSRKAHYPRAFFSLLLFLLRTRPQILHAHLLDAQLIGLTAAWFAGVSKRIYTRHTSTYHHLYSRSGIKYDRWSNCLATHIVSISQATDRTLLELEHAKTNKIRKIYHGFHMEMFSEANVERLDLLKSRWNIPDAYPLIGVIARHIEWKGVHHTIAAFSKLLNEYPSALLILANSHGPYHDELIAQMADLPGSSYILIPFEDDIVSLYALMDVYVHVPIDELCEAFGQTYVEALAAGVPSVFTKSGVAAEFVKHQDNAWVADFAKPDDIFRGIITLLKDESLRKTLKENGRQSVKALFGFERMIENLHALYEE